MIGTKRDYKLGDIEKISAFYAKISKSNCESNTLKCGWQCFSKHPCFVEFRPQEFGIWEDSGEIVGVVTLESPYNGAVNIDLLPKYSELYDEIIEYAEEHFTGIRKNGDKYLTTRVLTSNKELEKALKLRGYESSEPDYADAYNLSTVIPKPIVPEGFRIKSLEEVYLEPLATAKEYRNLGLAKACVYESLKKSKELGAVYAYVKPDDEAYGFYKKIGFVTEVRERSQWTKNLKVLK